MRTRPGPFSFFSTRPRRNTTARSYSRRMFRQLKSQIKKTMNTTSAVGISSMSIPIARSLRFRVSNRFVTARQCRCVAANRQPEAVDRRSGHGVSGGDRLAAVAAQISPRTSTRPVHPRSMEPSATPTAPIIAASPRADVGHATRPPAARAGGRSRRRRRRSPARAGGSPEALALKCPPRSSNRT